MNMINRVSTIQDLLTIPVPQETNTYKPILYGELDKLVREDIGKAGFQLEGTRFLTAHQGLEADGLYYIKYNDDKEMGLQIAWQDSYDKRVPLRFACGGYVFLCTNGAMIGDMGLFKAKHQGDIQQVTPGTITNIILNAGSQFDHMIKQREQMKNIEITKRTCAELIGRLFIEEKAITANQLGIIKKEIEHPTFQYGDNKNSLWQLYNDVTFSLRTDHPKHYMDDHINTHNFFAKEFELQ